MIYYGDEIGMSGGGDPDNRRDFPGGWPGDPRNAFEASGRAPEEQSVFEHVRSVTRLRASLEPLRRGTQVHLAAGEQFLANARVQPGSAAIAVINNSQRPMAVECLRAPPAFTMERCCGTEWACPPMYP